MPTPNETIAETPAVAVENSRPSRPHIACPEEAPTTHTPGWDQDVLHSREGAAVASPCPSEELGLEHAIPRVPSTDDEKVCTVSATTDQQRGPTEKEPQSVPSPTVAQKRFSRSSPNGSTPTLDCPFVSSPSHDFSTKRILPSYSCSFLRPGSKFVGKQTSDRSTYEVHVELKHVDVAESFLCGYLRIKGLTEDHPTLTTYFEGEMIGDKYSFQTRRPEWGSSEKNDFLHWSRFPAFRPIASKAKRAEFSHTNFAQKETIFMRWKEYFLVPDHRVRQITGASFEGFYYICFNQISGTVDGIYFHAKSEKFQKLQLEHVPERTFASVEFR